MPIGSIIGGLIGKGGADAAGAAAGRAGDNAYSRGREEAAANKSLASPYLQSGWAGTNALLRALGLGHLNPFNVDGGPSSTAYGETSLNTDSPSGDAAYARDNFLASPGYQWRLGEGAKALDRSAASKGMLLSGAQTKGLTDFNQNEASGEWTNYIGNLFKLSGQGAASAGATNNANTSALNAGNALNFQGDMGQAAMYSSGANALASGINKGIENGFSLAKGLKWI